MIELEQKIEDLENLMHWKIKDLSNNELTELETKNMIKEKTREREKSGKKRKNKEKKICKIFSRIFFAAHKKISQTKFQLILKLWGYILLM